MIERQIIEALNGSLDRLTAGQTVGDCLRAYPQVADELRSLLETGQAISRARASAAELRDARSRLDTRIISLIQETDFNRSRFQLPRSSVVLLLAVVLLVLIGVLLFLRREQPQFADHITLTLATEAATTPPPAETTDAPDATGSPTATQMPTATPTSTLSPTQMPTETRMPTARPTNAPLPVPTATELLAPQQAVDDHDTGPVNHSDDGAVDNEDHDESGNEDNGAND